MRKCSQARGQEIVTRVGLLPPALGFEQYGWDTGPAGSFMDDLVRAGPAFGYLGGIGDEVLPAGCWRRGIQRQKTNKNNPHHHGTRNKSKGTKNAPPETHTNMDTKLLTCRPSTPEQAARRQRRLETPRQRGMDRPIQQIGTPGKRTERFKRR